MPPAGRRIRIVWAAIVLGMFGAASVWLGATTPRDVPDTSGYTDFDFGFPELLAQERTLGYPLYLELFERVTGSHRWVCWGHAAIYAAAALFFAVSIPISPPTRLAVLVGLLGTNIYWLYADTIATDTPAAAMGLLATAFTVRFSRRRTWGHAVGLCLAAMAAWMTRPAMLAIIPASILIGLVATRATNRRELISGIALLGGLLCAPVLLFCLLRAATIGKFGIVSFGGYNLIGVVGQFPSADSAPLSSLEAQQIRDRVQQLKVADPPALAELPAMNYTRLEFNYDRTIWHWYVPAAQQVVGDDPAKVNSILRQTATEIAKSAPKEYAIWLVKASRQAVRQTLDDLAESPVGLLSIGLLAIAVIVRRTWPSPEMVLLVQISVLYWVSLAGLTILVCPPLGRMTDAAALFMTPTLLACAIDVAFSHSSNSPLPPGEGPGVRENANRLPSRYHSE